MSDKLTRAYESQARSLREFGYSDVAAGMVKDAHEKWLRGDIPQDVITMFCVGAFEKYPEIFGEPGEDQ